MQTSTDEFVKLVRNTVELECQLPDEVVDSVIRLTVLGQEKEASELIQRNSTLNPAAAAELIRRIGRAADDVFYLTGLRP